MPSKEKHRLPVGFGRALEDTALSPRVDVYQDINDEETDHTYHSDIDADIDADLDVDLDVGFHYYDRLSHFNSNSNNLKFYSEPPNSGLHSNDTPLGLTRSVGVLNLSLGAKTQYQDQESFADNDNDNESENNNNNNSKDNDDDKGNDDDDDNDKGQLHAPAKLQGAPILSSTAIGTSTSLKRTMSKTGFSITSPFSKNPSQNKTWHDFSSSEYTNLATVKTAETSNHSFSEAKPDPAAFQSSGLISKMKQKVLPKKLTIPDTPMKKSPLVTRHSDNELLGTPILEYSSLMSAHNHTTLPTMHESQLFKSPPLINTFPPSSDNSPTSSSNPRSKKRTKIVKNTELTSMLRQITDDLYGHDQESSIFSHSQSKDALQTPTKTSFDIGPDSPALIPKLQKEPLFSSQPSQHRTINASIMRNPDFHLTTKFSNVSIMGKGQFSTVYQVTFPGTGLKYAIKSVRPTKHNFTNRILQEINMLSTIQDSITNDSEGKEYIIEFISSWSHKGSFYIMTEFCENGNLDNFIQEHVIAKQQRLEDWRVWKIIVELCLALRFIHDSCSIVHLDLKPANVLITFEGNLKLADFGMATKLPIKDKSFENEGDREYIAPEIISDGIYDFRADIFSLGLMMVEIAANVILPDNGSAWHKLRSGDLSDAGRLSSTDIHSSSLFSNKKDHTNITDITTSDSKIPAWVPRFLLDGMSLEKMIRWMIEPDYRDRPYASDLLHTEELEYVEMTRKTGAVIHEDDYGPKPEFFS